MRRVSGRGPGCSAETGIDPAQDLVFWTDYFRGVGGRPEGTYADAGAVLAAPDGRPVTLWVHLYGVCAEGVENPEPADTLVPRAADALARRLSDLGFTGWLYPVEGRAAKELSWGRLGRQQALAAAVSGVSAGDLAPFDLSVLPPEPVDRAGRAYYSCESLMPDPRPPEQGWGWRMDVVLHNHGRPFLVSAEARASYPEWPLGPAPEDRGEILERLENAVIGTLMPVMGALGLPQEWRPTSFAFAHVKPEHHAEVEGVYDRLAEREARAAVEDLGDEDVGDGAGREF